MGKFVDRTLDGFRIFRSTFSFVHQNRIGHHLLLPIGAGFLVTIGLVAGVIFASGSLAEKLLTLVPSGTPAWAATLLRLGLIAAGITIVILLYRPLLSLLVLPFVATALNRVEEILLGRTIETSFAQDVKSALVGAWLGFLGALAGLVILVITIPLGPVQGAVMFLVNAYLLGKSAFDFVFEKEAETVTARRALVKAYRPEILGVGIGFLLLLFVPVLGAAAAPVYSVIAAARIRHWKP